LNPTHLTVFGTKILFGARRDLWITDGTSSGTSELQIPSTGLQVDDIIALGNNKALVEGSAPDLGRSNLWVTDGTGAGTTELTVAGAYSSGLAPQGGIVLGDRFVFSGRDAAGENNLWVTDGTAAGTSEILSNESSGGLAPHGFQTFGSDALFYGFDANGQSGLWETDGTSAGTFEIPITTAFAGSINPDDLVTVACYCRGTLIATARGETPVEDLEIGDLIMTVSGMLRPIKWIGRRSYGVRFVMGRKDIQPICFKQGSLGPGA
jgi:ELWxxDGT repeat protein